MCGSERDDDGEQVRTWIAGVTGSFCDRPLKTVFSLQWSPGLVLQSNDERLDLETALAEAIGPHADKAVDKDEIRRLARKMAHGLHELYLFDDHIRRAVLEPLIRRPHDRKSFGDNPLPRGRQKKQEIHAFAEWFAEFWVIDILRELPPARQPDSAHSKPETNSSSPYCLARDVLKAVKVNRVSPAVELVNALRAHKPWPLLDANINIGTYLIPPLPSGRGLAEMIRGPLNKKLDAIRLGLDGEEGQGALNRAILSDQDAQVQSHGELEGCQIDACSPDRRSKGPKSHEEAANVIARLDSSAKALRSFADKCNDTAQSRRMRMIAMALEGASLLER